MENEPQPISELMEPSLTSAQNRSGECEKPDHRQKMLWSQFQNCYAQAGFSRRHREFLRGRSMGVAEGMDVFRGASTTRILNCMSALRQQGGSVMLYGPRGTGKTQLAAWLTLQHAWWLSRADIPEVKLTDLPMFWYRAWPDLLLREKAGFDSGAASVLEEASGVHLLILDEVFEGLTTDWERSSFTRLIDRRYGAMLRTIVIGNSEEVRIPTLLGASAFSRLTETGLALNCDWEPYR